MRLTAATRLLLALVFSSGCATAGEASEAGGEGSTEPRRVAEQDLPPVPDGFTARQESGVWLVREADADASSVTISVAESGCLDLDHVTVAEGPDSVTIDAVVRVLVPGEGYGCPLPLIVDSVTIDLAHPLGQRKVIGGCAPGEGTAKGPRCRALAEVGT